MIDIFQAIILGIVQGITEFFPISSSGHLVLGEALFQLEAEGLFYFNVLVHVATLIAVIFYFRKTIKEILIGIHSGSVHHRQTALGIIIGTIPAILAVVFFKDQIDAFFGDPGLVLKAMFGTAVFFIFCEIFSSKMVDNEMTPLRSILIGIAQAFALIPGVSRSGSTLAMGLLNKLDRVKAAEFSFLLAIPAIAGAGLFSAIDAAQAQAEILWKPYFAGFIAALISGYISIVILMNLYKKRSLYWFAGYLILLSVIGHFVII